MIDPVRLLVGAVLAVLVVAGGRSAGALTRTGALGAFVVGTAVFGLGGPGWGLVLVAFFVSSSALSAWGREAKAPVAGEVFAKGSRRDLWQVLANGSLAALLAAGHVLAPDAALFVAYVGALAAVTADTWATELGLLSREPPRLITTGEIVPPGTSGGVTVLGTSAATFGAIVIGLVAAAVTALGDMVTVGAFDLRLIDLTGAARILLLTPVAGLAGSAFDSFLGATVQARYACPACGADTERRVHRCGEATRHTGGWRWMSNDAVNFLASVAGAIVAWGLYWLV